MRQRQMLAETLRNRKFILIPTCTDTFTARIIERLGFQCVNLGGYAFGASTALTEPLLTMMEMVNGAGHIARRINIPLMVDGGAGFGEPLHAMRMIREMEWAGIACTSIEDQIFPKRAHYHRDYKEHLVSIEEYTDKIRMAAKARTDPDFLIVARTDAMKTHGYDEAIKRLDAAVQAGADAVKFFPNTLEEARRAPKDLKVPCGYINSWGNRVGRPLLKAEEAAEMGYAWLTEAVPTVLVTLKAVTELYTHMRDQGICNLDREEAIRLRQEAEEILQLPEHYAIEEQTVEKG